jgi:hypothetical protein
VSPHTWNSSIQSVNRAKRHGSLFNWVSTPHHTPTSVSSKVLYVSFRLNQSRDLLASALFKNSHDRQYPRGTIIKLVTPCNSLTTLSGKMSFAGFFCHQNLSIMLLHILQIQWDALFQLPLSNAEIVANSSGHWYLIQVLTW